MSNTMSPSDAAVSPVPMPRWDFAEIVAVAMTVVIGISAFSWSFDALTGLAQMAGIRHQLAWFGPVFVDGAIVQAAVTLVALRRRQLAGVTVKPSTTWFFWGELMLAELVSVAGNGLHAAESGHRVLPAMIAAAVAGAAPVAGLAATHGLTALLEVPRPGDTTATTGDSTATAGDAPATPGDTDPTTSDAEATPGDGWVVETRDIRILRLHEAGRSYREIGAEVGVHHGTVGKILARLQAADEAQARELPAPQHFRLVAGGSPDSEFTQE